MVLEIADFAITPGSEEAFMAAFNDISEVLTGTPGCRSAQMNRSIESPARFVLVVEWDSVQAHEENFRATDRFTRWRAAIGPYFAQPPVVEHFEHVGAGATPR